MVPCLKFSLLAGCACLCAASVNAAETRQFSGMRGLNTVPDARFDETGRLTLNLSHISPYTHAVLGAQLTESVWVAIRQSAEGDDPLAAPRRLYPGLDTKIRLRAESARLPQIALGLQSAFGHKRHAGEFLALSKRFERFDVTGGIGWGRFAQAGHLKNPLKILPHFGEDRAIDGETSNSPGNWFTGERVGFFAGVSYALPIENLSITADYNADRYMAEVADTGHEPPAPWSVGLQYQPYDCMNAGVGLIGGDRIMARLTLTPSVPGWPLAASKKEPMPVVRPYRPNGSNPDQARIDAEGDGRNLGQVTLENGAASTLLPVEAHETTPDQIGRAARYIMNNTAGDVGTIIVQPGFAGLRGPKVRLVRRDLEQAYIHRRGSAEEIWRGTEFDNTTTDIAFGGFKQVNLWPEHIVLENRIGLSEEDQGILYRTGLILEQRQQLPASLVSGGALRFNLKNNLENLNEYRPRSLLPVRSDADLFARQNVSLDRLYLGWLKTVQPDLHVAFTAGYLEEMYAGAGAEILYRPFGKNWAIGAEAFQVMKRNPLSTLNQGLTIDGLLTGHLQAWYKLPQSPETTLQLRVGRYLAEDLGATFALDHRFKNGAALSGFMTMSQTSDYDLFGEEAHLHHGLRLSLPIGSLDYVPRNSRIDVIAEPFGRDSGQALDKPLKLYDLTDAFSLQHMASNWGDISAP